MGKSDDMQKVLVDQLKASQTKLTDELNSKQKTIDDNIKKMQELEVAKGLSESKVKDLLAQSGSSAQNIEKHL